MILTLLGAIAGADEPATATPPPPLRPPITEIEHPRYVDAAGTPLRYRDLKALAASTDALPAVRSRRLGRTAVRLLFLAATAGEVWATAELASGDPCPNQLHPGRPCWTTYPVAAQTALTGVCEILAWTNLPSALVEDHAIVLRGANEGLAPNRYRP
ncbi:MAG: hypothetical protein ABMB14_05340 [Myxococcota bacterium]